MKKILLKKQGNLGDVFLNISDLSNEPFQVSFRMKVDVQSMSVFLLKMLYLRMQRMA